MKLRALIVLMFTACSCAAWCQGLTLTSSNPANMSTVTVPVSSIVMTFNADVLPAGVTVYRYGRPVPGILSMSPINTMTFTPTTAPLQDGQYLVDLRAVRNRIGTTLTGLRTITFIQNTRSGAGILSGSADPAVVTLAPGQRAGVSYIIRNSSNQSITLQSSAAQFAVNGTTVATANLPISVTIPAQSQRVVSSNVTINDQIANAARAAGTDQVLLLRRFVGVGGAAVRVPPETTIPVNIKIGSSLAGPATVTEVILDVPQNGKSVGQSEQIRGHAFIRGTGTGPIAGTWYVDNQPVETFQVNMIGGFTQEVRTRLSLPTLDLGPHKVVLQIARPAPVSSNTHTYMVVQGGPSSQKVYLVRPSDELPMPREGVHTSFRWAPMPGASGYEIAFAQDVSGLGLDENGKPVSPLLNMQTWTRQMVESRKIISLIKLPSDATSWTPSEDEFSKLTSSPSGKVVWAVRAIYPAQEHGDPSTTSKPRSIKLQPRPVGLALVIPAASARLDTAYPRFEWQAGPEGVTYEFVILSTGKTIFRALTRNTYYTLTELSAFKLTPGNYAWRVSAVKAGEGVVAASNTRLFVVTNGAAAAKNVSPVSAFAHPTSLIIAGGLVGVQPGAVPEITMSPADGSTINEQQPVISATYPESKPENVMLTLNGVDVTALANVKPTGLTLQPPGVFSEGSHAIAVTVATNDGRTLQSTSKFAVSAAATAASATEVSATSVSQPLADQPLKLNMNWNWNGNNDTSANDTLTIDFNLLGAQSWAGMGGSYASINAQVARPMGEKFDLTNLLAEGSISDGDYKLMAGDIGASGSELTTQGTTYRALDFVSSAGPVKFSAVQTLGNSMQRSDIVNTPDILSLTAETAQSTPEKGMKLSYVDSKGDTGQALSLDGQTKSKVLSLSGRTPLGRTGLNVRAELAKSDSTCVSALGSQTQTGNAVNAALDGVVGGFGISTTYRLIGNDYLNPASTTLTNSLKGWTFAVNHPFGQFVNTTVNYSLLNNDASSAAPASSLISKSVDLAVTYPNLPPITFQFARNEASADPFTGGTVGSRTQEDVLSVGTSYSGTIWDAYLNYSKSDFNDFLDVVNPLIDVPNDHSSGTWAVGLGVKPSKALSLRFDWGSNRANRWFLPVLSPTPVAGVDKSDQFRAQLEYLINSRFSSTLAVSNSDYADALGAFSNKSRDISLRLNYLLRVGKSGGLTITGEWLHSSFGIAGGEPGNTFSILVNDNRVIGF